MRADGRENNQLRSIVIETHYQKTADGSALIKWGDTHVLCAASIDESVPPFRENSGGGWVTAEYSMLPGSTRPRKNRKSGGRETEIQRLIGRSLRAVVDMQALGKRSITVDCDVIQADGGTRVASITGGYVALALAINKLKGQGKIPTATPVLIDQVAAVSVGLVDGMAVVDLPYVEDSKAQVDMNLVMTKKGAIVEIQGTAEGAPFHRKELDTLYELGWQGIAQLFKLQTAAL